jgi:hypothetical protein
MYCLRDSPNKRSSVNEDGLEQPICWNMEPITTYTGGHGYTTKYYCKECKKELLVEDYR